MPGNCVKTLDCPDSFAPVRCATIACVFLGVELRRLVQPRTVVYEYDGKAACNMLTD